MSGSQYGVQHVSKKFKETVQVENNRSVRPEKKYLMHEKIGGGVKDLWTRLYFKQTVYFSSSFF